LSDVLEQTRSLAVSLFDLSGRQLISTIADNTGSPLRIAVPQLVPGTYVVRITTQNGDPRTLRIAVE
jgi:hypothetical protein